MDPEGTPEDNPFQTDLKKYYFSGTVQDGNKGYFVGWYIDQKTKREEFGKMKIINVEQREELIQSLIRSNGQLVDDVAFLKKRVKEMTNKYHEAYSRAQENLENPDETPVGRPKGLRDKTQL